jgi:hypothetical protein
MTHAPAHAAARPHATGRDARPGTADRLEGDREMPRAHTAVERLPVTEYTGTFPGEPCQVPRARREVARFLAGHPAAEDAALIVSELAGNAVTHSQSKGQTFTVHAEIHGSYLWIECEDAGGSWVVKTPGDRMHGLAIVGVLVGPDNWGVDGDAGGRAVWVRIEAP